MQVEFHLKSSELTDDLLERIKQIFQNETVRFFIEDENMDETEYLISSKANQEMLDQSIKEAQEGEVVDVSWEELKKQT